MIPHIEHQFSAPLWIYQGQGAWHFITLPKQTAKDIKALIIGPRRGWGSVRVQVTIGSTTWKTSIFPYKELESLNITLKLAVRKAEGLAPNKKVRVTLVVLE